MDAQPALMKNTVLNVLMGTSFNLMDLNVSLKLQIVHFHSVNMTLPLKEGSGVQNVMVI